MNNSGGMDSAQNIDIIVKALLAITNNTVSYKKRYLAKAGTRLISVDVSEVAFFYIKDRIQFIKTKDNKDYIIDKRMDDIEADMDPSVFFRVNRQFILSYESIKKVQTWFSGKLIIETYPLPFEDIIMGRLKTAEFRKWLGE